ncbi:hypothetical protein HGA92_00315 [Candidatus Gracilibacteria bacterium]|nr:hypothetical protein [Candidatus Gracilibacteria bacterium]NUJ98945.1 hypothetical protein [Candidatus Gracilibacteria bacterium]
MSLNTLGNSLGFGIKKEYSQQSPGISDAVKNLVEQNNITIEVYNPSDFPEYEMQEVINVIRSGFGVKVGDNDIKSHIFKSTHIYIIKNNGIIIGFSSIIIINGFVYRFGTSISKEQQGKGLYKILGEKIGNDGKYFLRTQNQNIINSLKKQGFTVLLGEDAYDFLLNNGMIEEELNYFFTNLDGGKKCLEKGLFKGVYGGPMGNKQNVRFVDENFYPGFNYENGDSLLVAYYKNEKYV